ncbi:MAG: proton-conducting transporter membrane subunit [Pseudomonadota bacterium]|nr:proton-conducting transporter membrane subunit [Pseudomonadota bacterium]
MSSVVLPVVLPLLAAFLLQPLDRVSESVARLLGPAVLVASAWVIFQVWMGHGDVPFNIALGGFAPPLGINFYVDKLALLFAMAVPLFGLLFWPWAGEHEGRAREQALMLLLLAAATGLTLSGDLFNIYVFYELVAVASFGLVTVKATGRAYVATVRYLLLSAFGSVLALVGVAIVYTKTGTLNLAQLAQLAPEMLHDPLGLAAFVLLLIGFGVKAELFPVNTWVPEVYATAPARISALLAGLVSKLAVLVAVRLLVLVFNQPEAMQVMLVLGILGTLTGELAAWRAKDFPRMLAYSSIGQLGMVFIAFSIPGPAGLLAGLAVMLHHLIVKPALFGLAARWNGSLDALTGAARSSPIAAGLFVLFALSLIGVPPLPGFWTKLLVLVGLAQEGQPLQMAAFATILVVTVIEANYLFRLAVRLYRRVDEPPAPHARLDISAAALLGAVLVAVTLMIDPVGDRLRSVAEQATDVPTYVTTVFPQSVVASDGVDAASGAPLRTGPLPLAAGGEAERLRRVTIALGD